MLSIQWVFVLLTVDTIICVVDSQYNGICVVDTRYNGYLCCSSLAEVDVGNMEIKECYACNYFGPKVRVSDENSVNTCVQPGEDTETVPCPYGVCRKAVYTTGGKP